MIIAKEVISRRLYLNVAYYTKQAGLKLDLVSCVGNDKNSNIPLNVVKKNSPRY